MSTERAVKKRVYDAKILRNISISTKQLFDIYNTLTYINFSTKEEQPLTIDLDEVLRNSVAYYKELCESKHIVLHLQSESCHFPIAKERASMLFGNLISNAIKYSLANSNIFITFKDNVFKIEDHGIGIAEEKLDQIFERYSRATEYAGGFGVGLSIVENICHEYGIKIEVESEMDKGTIFILKF